MVHSAIYGHRCGEKGKFCRYSVWRNKNDQPIIIDGTATECAKVMGISNGSFRSICVRVWQGKNKKYTIIRRWLDDDET